MNIRILWPCLACLLLVTGCKFSYKYECNRSTSDMNGEEHRSEMVNKNGRMHCTYSFKTSKVEYKVASNGRIKIKEGVLENLSHGQTVDVVATESGNEYRYQIIKTLTGTETKSLQGPLTTADEERIQRAVKAIGHAPRHAEQSARQAQAMQEQARQQAEAAQRQAEEIERQAQRQAQALQRQAEALQRQAEAMQKQAEEIQRKISEQH